MRTRLLLDKLGQTECDRLVDHVAPKDPTKMKQEELDLLKYFFCDKTSLTWRCIKILNYEYDKSVPIKHIDRTVLLQTLSALSSPMTTLEFYYFYNLYVFPKRTMILRRWHSAYSWNKSKYHLKRYRHRIGSTLECVDKHRNHGISIQTSYVGYPICLHKREKQETLSERCRKKIR